MSQSESRTELSRLVAAHRENRLTADEGERLGAILTNDAEARRYFAEQLLLTSMLEMELTGAVPEKQVSTSREADAAHGDARGEQPFLHSRLHRIPTQGAVGDDLHKEAVAQDVDRDAVARRSVLRRLRDRIPAVIASTQHPIRFGAFVMAATLLIYMGLFAWVLPSWRDEANTEVAGEFAERPIVATVTRLERAIWAEKAKQWGPGAKLKQGREISLESGLVELAFVDGARVIVEGPCQFELNTTTSGILQSGNLVARVAQSAHGFAVTTPAATIIDLGTEFGASVDEKTSHVHVFEGKVRVQSNGTAESVVLVAGENASVGMHDEIVVTKDRTGARFVRSLPAQSGFIAIPVGLVEQFLQNKRNVGVNGFARLLEGAFRWPAKRNHLTRLQIGESITIRWSAGAILRCGLTKM